MLTRKDIEELSSYKEDGLMVADGLDDAIMGLYEDCVVYDRDKVIGILMDRDGMDISEAVSYFEYNMEGAYASDKMPIYVQTKI